MKFVYINILIIAIEFVTPLQVTMERVAVVEVNKKYFVWANSYVKRYGRKSPYYFNIEGEIRHQWANNVSIHLLFFEYLHNEYRRSFVEMHFKLCDALNGEPYIGKMIAKTGITCPLAPGEYHLMNMTVEAHEFPHVWPFSKCKVQAGLRTTDTKETIGTIDVFVTFVQKKKH